jgi:hypothetical protein
MKEGHTQHMDTTTSLFLFSVPHPNSIPPVFATLTNTHEALVLALHTRKQVSLSYVTQPPNASPSPPNLFKHSSTSLATTHLRLRLPLPLRTHLTARNKTLPFILNFLSHQRHQTRSSPSPSYNLPREDFGKSLVFPSFPSF